MGIYDNVILHPDVEVDGFPFDPAQTPEGDWRWWQTKDLNPSMDVYMIRPPTGRTGPRLFRRHPPIFKWTTTNEGWLGDGDIEVVDGADHWRDTRFTGTMELVDIAEDNRSYYLLGEFRNGTLSDIWLDSYGHHVDNEIPEQYTDLDIEVARKQRPVPSRMGVAWEKADRCPDCGAELSAGAEIECEGCGAVFECVEYLQRR